ncbi:HSP20-like chaperone [Pseudocohnilembus persalinus]|uniref:HSP20-like chaperone n=1 Tax=Pseudocohnilembus persalinus TaxID=266149 RepID=A0A0V0QYJ6_PSEPJ|nr:HSP20-like chaperone [Pseudocohnilembus persalinus]|eukprot:KRX07339.1 HSP20-like chaperone [Pseudocohnilembus persalinus]
MQTPEQQKKIEELSKQRQKFTYQGRTVYEWDQTLDDVNIYIDPPKCVLKKYEDEVRKQLKPGQQLPKLDIKIQPNHISIGIKGNPPFINEDLAGTCDSDESYWCIEDDELHIILQKAFKGQVWQSALKGHQGLDPLTQSQIQKNLLLERFQQENPGFDFSQAEVNGQAPDPRTFMGGIKHE